MQSRRRQSLILTASRRQSFSCPKSTSSRQSVIFFTSQSHFFTWRTPGTNTEESYIRKSGGKWEARHCQRWMLYCRSPSNSDSVSQLWAAAEKLTSCKLAAVPICPRPSPPSERRNTSRRRADRRACRRQRSSRFPRWILSHARRCSCLVCKRRGEYSGLVTLTFDLLTLKVVSESRVTWATCLPILVFLGLSVLDLSPMYATDRRHTSDRQTSDSIIAQCPRLLGAGHNNSAAPLVYSRLGVIRWQQHQFTRTSANWNEFVERQ